MTNAELIAYIDQSRKAGQSDDAIEKTLTSAGWPADMVRAGLRPAAANAAASVLPAAAPAPAAPIAAAKPATSLMPPTAAPSPTAGASTPGARKGKGAIIGGIVAAVLVLGGVAGAAYMGYISVPFLGGRPPSLSEAVAKLAALNSARASVTLNIAAQPKAPTTPVLNMAAPADDAEGATLPLILNSMLESLPADAKIDLTASGDWARGQALAEANSAFEASYSAGSLSIAVAADTRTTGGYTYLHPTKLPSIIVDLSGLVDKWIRIKDFSSVSLYGGSEVLDTDYKDDKDAATKDTKDDKDKASFKDAVAELNLILEKGEKNGAFTVSSVDSKAQVNGKPAWRMTLKYDPVKYREAFKAAYDERAARMPDAKTFLLLSDEALKSMGDPKKQARMDELAKALTFTLAVDKKSGYPAEVAIDGTLAVDATGAPKLKDRQMRFALALGLTNPNEPVTVTAPEQWISPQEAVGVISGVPREQVLLSQQISNVDDIREALAAYFKKNQRFPATLDELVGFTWKEGEDEEKAAPAASGSDDLGLKYSSSFGLSNPRKTVIGMPPDAFTGKPFPYAATAAGYTLSYEMRMAEAMDDSAYVDGTNTATKDVLSVEGNDPSIRAAREKARLDALMSGPDTDGDGLPDRYEESLGTNPNNKDTDGDTYDDKTEVEHGENPVGIPTTTLGLSRMRSRDSKRVADVKQIQTAFELFYADHDRYPPAGAGAVGTEGMKKICGSGWKPADGKCGNFANDFTYMGIVPSGPLPPDGTCAKSANEYRYTVSPDGKHYTLTFCIGDDVGSLKAGKNTATEEGIAAGFNGFNK